VNFQNARCNNKDRLRVSRKGVLRRIFGSKRDEVTGEWTKLHYEELNDLYCSPNMVWVIKIDKQMGGACSAYMAQERRVQGFGGET
jgi:hypothetical protein